MKKFILILVIFHINNELVGNQFRSCYLEDIFGQKYSISSSFFLKQKTIFVFIDIVSCHKCIMNVSNLFNLLDTGKYDFEVVGVGISQGSVASKKLIYNVFKKYFKVISRIFFTHQSDKFFEIIFSEKFTSPTLVLWNSSTNKFFLINYIEIFDDKGNLQNNALKRIHRFLNEN